MNKEKIKYVTLSQIVKRVKVGFVGSIEKFYCNKDDGILLLRTNNLTPLGIDYSNVKYVTKDFFEKNKKSQLHKNDILIARHGDNGKANIYELDEEAQALNVVIIEPNNEKMSSTLIKYLFDSPYVKKQISSSVSGSVQNVINTKQIENLEIPIFESINYKKIESILKNIDNKIKLNNKINSELENMAKIIYDYWFLQFEFPNNEGKPYKSSGGKMVWNEELKKEIPDGWEAKKLINYCSLKNGINYNNEELSGEKYKIINVRNISSSTLFINDSILDKISISSDIANKYTIDEDDILIARSGTPGQVRIIKSNENIIYSGFIIKCKVNEIRYKEYFVYVLKKIENSILNQSNGSILKNINQESLSNLTIIIPSMECINNFNNKVIAIHNKIKNLMEENQELISLRDYLLPLLMNGQIGFKD